MKRESTEKTFFQIDVKKYGLVIAFALMSIISFGQLDSIQVNFTTEESPTDAQIQITNVQVTASIDSDIDFGGLFLSITTERGHRVEQLNKSKAQLESDGQLLGNSLNVSFSDISYSESYIVKFLVRRSDGANFPVMTNNYNN